MRVNSLQSSPPFEVEHQLKKLGARLRTARLRRNLTLEQVAEKIGTTRKPIAEAEKGSPTTAFVVYAALLWVYDMTHQLDLLADPIKDTEGNTLEAHSRRLRARAKAIPELDNDF